MLMEEQTVRQLDAVVYGRVQGVSFRYYTRQEAERLGLDGWVANQRDGTVRVMAQGSGKALEELARFLHRGPAMARVNKVELNYSSPDNRIAGFRVLWL